MNIAVDDLGNSAAKKYDLEAWLPGQGRYRELTSCSNTTAYQARRLDVRHRPEEGASPRHVHTLNGTAVAVGRTIIAIAENHQREDGTVDVPAVLHAVRGAGDDLTLRVRACELEPRRARAPRARLEELRRAPEVVRWWQEPEGDWLAEEADTVKYAVLARGRGDRLRRVVRGGGADVPPRGHRPVPRPGRDTAAASGPRRCACSAAHLIDELGFHRLVIDPEVDQRGCDRELSARSASGRWA